MKKVHLLVNFDHCLVIFGHLNSFLGISGEKGLKGESGNSGKEGEKGLNGEKGLFLFLRSFSRSKRFR